jgi:hypothetical protein
MIELEQEISERLTGHLTRSFTLNLSNGVQVMKIQNAGLSGHHANVVDLMWYAMLAAMEKGELPEDDDKWGLLNELGERLDRHLLPARIEAVYPSIHALSGLVNYDEFLDGFIGHTPEEQAVLLNAMEEIFEYEGLRQELLSSGFGLKISAQFYPDYTLKDDSFFGLVRDGIIVCRTSFDGVENVSIRNLFDNIRRHKIF